MANKVTVVLDMPGENELFDLQEMDWIDKIFVELIDDMVEGHYISKAEEYILRTKVLIYGRKLRTIYQKANNIIMSNLMSKVTVVKEVDDEEDEDDKRKD